MWPIWGNHSDSLDPSQIGPCTVAYLNHLPNRQTLTEQSVAHFPHLDHLFPLMNMEAVNEIIFNEFLQRNEYFVREKIENGEIKAKHEKKKKKKINKSY